MITLLLLMACLPFPGETQFLGFVRANHRALFPQLLSQSQFNRRARQLWPWVEALRRHWAEALGATRASLYLLDTKPLPVVGYTRRKDRSDFAATADYGVCASRHLKYFGYKLVLLCTPTGVPAAYELVPASTDERVAGEQVLDWVWQARILGDKGFIGADWQQGYRETRGLASLTPARANQRTPGPSVSSGGSTACGNGSKAPSTRCRTPAAT
ncbi:MAG: IS982 family transposase [Caldilineaceae bacterium]|nr:IS982 family transposase [Caldilineaceae bacterium]